MRPIIERPAAAATIVADDVRPPHLVVDPQTLRGNVHQVDHVPSGPTNSAAITTMFPLRRCGGKLLVAVTRERRYGPSRLRVDDDDDGDATIVADDAC